MRRHEALESPARSTLDDAPAGDVPQSPDEEISDEKRSDETPRLTSEAVLSRGHWRVSDTSKADGTSALRWEPNVRLGERLRRGITVPVLVGVVVFTAAVAIAIGITMARGHGVHAEASSPSPAASQVNRSDTEEELAADGAGTEGNAADRAGVGDPGATGAAQSNTPVLVHVVGEVNDSGVVELPAGSRVADALDAAGGVTQSAVLDVVNLARTVADGEQVIVPDAELAEAWRANPSLAGGGGGGRGGAGRAESSAVASAGGGDSGSAGAGAVSLNAATVDDLDTLPRIGPALAQRIVDWRDANGGFTAVDQLLEVPGIGAKTVDGLRDLVVL